MQEQSRHPMARHSKEIEDPPEIPKGWIRVTKWRRIPHSFARLEIQLHRSGFSTGRFFANGRVALYRGPL